VPLLVDLNFTCFCLDKLKGLNRSFVICSVTVLLYGVLRFCYMECYGFVIWSVTVLLYGVLRFCCMECYGFVVWSVTVLIEYRPVFIFVLFVQSA
jgi:nitrate reductase NapE component